LNLYKYYIESLLQKLLCFVDKTDASIALSSDKTNLHLREILSLLISHFSFMSFASLTSNTDYTTDT